MTQKYFFKLREFCTYSIQRIIQFHGYHLTNDILEYQDVFDLGIGVHLDFSYQHVYLFSLVLQAQETRRFKEL